MAQPSKADPVQARSRDNGGSSNVGHDDEDHDFRTSLDGTRESLMHAGESVGRKARSIWEGFSDFALRDNVLEVATGLMYVPFSVDLL